MSDIHMDDHAREAVEHLQAAALELIAVARVALDAAEELVRDPAPFLAFAAQAAVRGRAGADGPAPAAPPRPRVQHVKVS